MNADVSRGENCPNGVQLKAYLEQCLDSSDWEYIESHLNNCTSCQFKLEKILGFRCHEDPPEDRTLTDDLGAVRRVEQYARKFGLDIMGSSGESKNEEQEPMPLVEGYRIIKYLGRGGMGTVWQAEELGDIHRVVAIKVIRSSNLSGFARERFLMERKTLASLEHPHLARLYSAGITADGNPYYAMEQIDGVPLTDFVKLARLSLRDRLKLFVIIARTVQFAHSKAIVHRDLKPNNILVRHDSNGVPAPFVIDFGIARNLDLENSLSRQSGPPLGTIRYASPEQIRATTDLGVDTRADIYSLGVILFELLTGDTPLTRDREHGLDEVVHNICHIEAPRPSNHVLKDHKNQKEFLSVLSLSTDQLARQIKGDLDWICQKALAKSPDERYQTAADFAEDVARTLTNRPTLAHPPTTFYQVKKFYLRNRAVSILALLILLALVSGIGGTTYGMVRAMIAEKSAYALAQSESVAKAAEVEAKQQEIAARQREETARIAAENRAEQLDQSNRILRDIFHGLNPQKANASTAALRNELSDRLAAGADRLDRLGNSLDVARLKVALAEAQLALTFTNKAIPLFEDALESVSKELGAESDDTLALMNHLAAAYEAGGQEQDALQVLLDANAIRARKDPPETQEIAMTQTRIASLLGGLGDTETELKLKQQSYEQLEAISEPDSVYLIACGNDLAIGYFKNEQYEKAIRIWEPINQQLEKLYGRNHEFAKSVAGNLALAYLKIGAFEKAREIQIRILEDSIEQFGKESPLAALPQHNLALSLIAEQKYDEAIDMLKTASNTFRQHHSEKHPLYLKSCSELGEAYLRKGAHEEAARLLAPLSDSFIEVFGEAHGQVQLFKNRLQRATEKSQEPDRKDTDEIDIEEGDR